MTAIRENYNKRTESVKQHFVVNRRYIMSDLVFHGLLPTYLGVFFCILNDPTFLHCGFQRPVCV